MTSSPRWSLRWLLPLLVLGSTLAAASLSFLHQVRSAERLIWTEARAQAQRELALLTVIAERSGVDDTPLLAELVVQSTADPRVLHALVLEPGGRVLVSTNAIEAGRPAAELPLLDPTWTQGLLAGGPARLIELRGQGLLVAVQALSWPSSGQALREMRPGVVLLRYDLGFTLRALWRNAVADHLGDIAMYLAAALALFLVLDRLVRRPLGRLGEVAAAIGAGRLDTRVPPMATREMALLGEGFNRMADDLALRLRQLGDSELRHRILIATAPDAMISVSALGRIDSFNGAAEAVFGWPAHELLGQPIERLLPAGLPAAPDAEALERTLPLGQGGIVQGRHRDGRALMLELGLSTSWTQGERRTTVVARDVGQRLATEAELLRHREHLEDLVAERTTALARSRDEAQAATRAKSEFLANMSHEIRTPMNAILGLAHLTRRDASPQQLAHLDKLAGAARHLLAILNDILDFSKIEAGKLTLSHRDFDVDDLVDQACHLVCERAMAKGLEVVQRIDPTLPTHLRGDDLRLGQVLVNLIGNAVKFTDSGHVRVNLRRAQAPDGRPLVRYEVRDTGIGMDASQQARIFQAFEQADTSTTRRFGGTGLGLTISRRLVELMGGTLRVESREGQGSRFWFDLPLETALAPVPGRRAVARFEGRHALLVDDLEDARVALTEMLEMLGLRVTAVAGGEQALRSLAAAEAAGDPCELCVLDWRMPGMDGLETARQIRALPLDCQPAFLMISAMGGQLPAGATEAVGFAGVLVKPVSPSQLHDALTRALRSEEPAPPSAPERRHAPDPRSRVLLVEDNPLNREVSAQLLEAAGLSPDLASDGLVALEMARQSHYDLILMDVQMPTMDGLEATRQIRALPGHASTPIVAMTANAFQDDRERCREAGMDDFISKPVDPADLDRALDRWLPTLGTGMEPVEPAPAGTTGLPAIDGLDMVFALQACGGSERVLWRLLQVFVTHHASDAAQLREARRAGRPDDAARLLHGLRGAAATLGAHGLVAQVQAAETALQRGVPLSPMLAEPLEQSLEALINRLQQALQARVSPPA